MATITVDDLKKELQNGALVDGHPFRYFTLGTVGLDRLARLRTVVLRKVSDDLKLTFYTDVRSKKVIHLKENNKVGLLFYHPGQLLQFKVEGLAKVFKGEASNNEVWQAIDPNARKNYATSMAPGTELEDPAQLQYLEGKSNFCVVEVTPFKIEYLKLQQPHHTRIRFSFREGKWSSDYLVP
ncbi:pyridoxamine 5'-phosphate oxidase family protein [Muriicola sp. Z0-33]|uniref:pyridoxamine 5'-phosphate oxidase family protein n=1 Tax=Muriicola sp. Z0-33 TaxID=2816957 RepID=UPI002237E425|nr:pyridoxamine 5'-phosphate oxidase family protein [Muriicola sp. Z0-33]MCW5517275.1 pyridoxamine 5'-phosphate oxidase family protein [Muriicola sp. Z0-33]